MTHVPHELTEEFPRHVTAIQDLKVSDPHFRKLMQSYHHVNRTLHRVETNIEPMDDVYTLELRRERMWLKDQIARKLGAFAEAVH